MCPHMLHTTSSELVMMCQLVFSVTLHEEDVDLIILWSRAHICQSGTHILAVVVLCMLSELEKKILQSDCTLQGHQDGENQAHTIKTN